MIHLDIETADPDDLFMLAILANHPLANLQWVSVFPGGKDQVSLVKHVLSLVNRNDIKVFANTLDDSKDRVSTFYNKWLGSWNQISKDGSLDDLAKLLKDKRVNLLTGGPIKNIHYLYEKGIKYNLWTCQGGFVGQSIYDKYNLQTLEKFHKLETVPTFNLNGSGKCAEILLSANEFSNNIRMVGKNVCHRFTYDKNDIVRIPKHTSGLRLFSKGAELICDFKGQVKAMHDLLAMVSHIDSNPFTWVTGKPYKKSGQWGFIEDSTTNITHAIDYDKSLVESVLFK